MKENWILDIDEVSSNLKTDVNNGLSTEEAKKRLEKYGPNNLSEKNKRTVLSMLLDQFKDYMVIILIIASIVSLFLGEITDAVIILFIILLNAFLGMIQENNAEKSLESLKKLSAPVSRVLRDGKVIEIESQYLVPGDVVFLEAGNFVPADGRIIESANLKIDESALTGESIASEKIAGKLSDKNLNIGDRINMVYMGTIVTYGRGLFVVTETGMDTEMGKIAKMLDNEDKVKTPLQIKLEQLGKYLGTGALIICAIIFIIGVIEKRPVFDMFMTSVSLAVAAIPEGLPAIVTITLALGVQKMIKRNAIIRKLPAVETLGSANVICSDKTGTLTQNKMTVVKVYTDFKELDLNDQYDNRADFLLECSTLCTDAFIDDKGKSFGDPTEVAIVSAFEKNLSKKSDLENKYPRVSEIPFDSDRKMMTTIHKAHDNNYKVITKGAFDNVIERCKYILKDGKIENLTDDDKSKIKLENEKMGNNALRVLAISYKNTDDIPERLNSDDVEKDLIFIGLLGMIDPPREEVKDSVKICKMAGIKPVMITGDHKITAMAIAKELGILNKGDMAVTGRELEAMTDDELYKKVKDISVYARVSPEHKMRIVKAWQRNNAVVAMTGDGVNDAPALKQADIGAAMGITGTDVAKDSADMILTDDNFATIVAAIEEGRTIYENIKKSIHYLLSCNIGEILVLLIATLAGMPMPLKPIHILWVNLVTDSLPALALGVEPADKDIMTKKPRPKNENIFADGLMFRIPIEGIMIGLVSFIAFLFGLRENLTNARTMAFAVLTFSQLSQAMNARSNKSIFKVGLLKNKYMVLALAVSIFLQLVVILTPLNAIFGIKNINIYDWDIIILLSLSPIIIMEIVKALFFKTK
ncbi:calcium-transporting P-type ATPase, PMR1-type [Thermoanaerobacterium thermosaccharolyticum]|uniref:P-type Ca(2+) transporter n=1 Tax=Thermoanaerobacterium thermosaccharolyticum M0795 TaxID=698948 RepID=L0ILC0_THETR|nr:calcium-transporting P-type ATPase, PMR1-type [Thermoanaerobacterium thermosaccharolyticum]AGB18772.1 sarco/endoplasmic reticulum calcium-translocating P-type ATPase/plasma-membrane calcium-translocating P-type ATPase/golgi membrane calcium-translocating P-type ATPase [Thermoanaerobacterium thermosaccharolyticum M0795]